MSNIKFSINKINNEFINKLDSGINNINNMLNLFDRLDKPKSFSYNTYLKKIPVELNSIKEDCLDIKRYIIKSNNNYIEMSKEIDSIIKKTS